MYNKYQIAKEREKKKVRNGGKLRSPESWGIF